MTPQEIFEYKNAWKPHSFQINLHSDLHIDCKDWCRKHLERWEWSMDTYTHVYAHTFHFEKEEYANAFKEKFAEWVDKGTN